jgi:hypothetical protein
MRAAVVGGAGYYAGKKAAEGRAYQDEQDARIADLEQQQYYTQQQTAAAPPAGGLSEATMQQLQQLGQLKAQGILTDEEFEAQKRKLLGMA